MPKPELTAIKGDRTLTEQAYVAIRAAIIDGRLVSGDLYSVQTLAEAFDVSRTPVREALIDLSRQGMVRFERNRGVRILQTSIHDLEEIFALRLLLEVPGTYRAAGQIDTSVLHALRKEFAAMEDASAADDEPTLMHHDRRFHQLILERSGNRRLAEYVDHLRDLVLIRGISTVEQSRSLADIVTEHREILKALESRDAALAARSMRRHILHTGRLLLQQEGRDPDAELDWADITWAP